MEITARIAKATSAYGRLVKRLWTNRGIRLDTKVAVYKAAVLSSLLYGSEVWTLNAKQLRCLEKFHQATLRRIARIKWVHKVTNYEVLQRCNISSLQSMIEDLDGLVMWFACEMTAFPRNCCMDASPLVFLDAGTTTLT